MSGVKNSNNHKSRFLNFLIMNLFMYFFLCFSLLFIHHTLYSQSIQFNKTEIAQRKSKLKQRNNDIHQLLSGNYVNYYSAKSQPFLKHDRSTLWNMAAVELHFNHLFFIKEMMNFYLNIWIFERWFYCSTYSPSKDHISCLCKKQFFFFRWPQFITVYHFMKCISHYWVPCPLSLSTSLKIFLFHWLFRSMYVVNRIAIQDEGQCEWVLCIFK